MKFFKYIVLIFIFFISFQMAEAGILFSTPNNLGLVGYWAFNDGAGTSATDSSGSGNTGTLTTMDDTDWVAGKRGKALDFDGSSDYVSIASDLGASTNISVSFWIKPSSGSQQNGILSSATNLTAPRVYIELNTDYTIDFYRGAYTTSDVTISSSEWTHVMITNDGSNTNYYINGVYDKTIAQTVTKDTQSAFYLGRGFAGYFNGQLDDVRIYNRVLSAGEISTLYKTRSVSKRKTVSRSGLVGHWKFDDASGISATDSSGQGNTGTLNGSMTDSDWVNGKRGKALDFDGTNDYVDLGSSKTYISSTAPFSTSFWFNAESSPNTYSVILGLKTDLTNQLQIGYSSDSNFDFHVIFSGQGAGSGVFSNLPSANEWHHGIITFDGVDYQATGSYKIYIDGVSQSLTSASSSGGATNANAIGWRIGGVSTNYFKGKIDDVRIYDRVLSSTEVAALYNETSAKFQSTQDKVMTDGLVGYWSFNGKTMFNNVGDSSGQGNNGNKASTLATSTFLVPGKIGQAWNFLGTGNDTNAINISDSSVFDTGSELTTSLWYKTSNKSMSSKAMLVHDFSQYKYIGGYITTNSSSLQSYVRTPTGVTNVAWSPGADTLADGSWHNVIFVYNRYDIENSRLRLYFDGALKQVSTGYDEDIVDGDEGITLGRWPGHSFTGFMDEVRIYNRALSATEVLRLYNLGK